MPVKGPAVKAAEKIVTQWLDDEHTKALRERIGEREFIRRMVLCAQ